MKRIWIPQTIASAFLLWALMPTNPYAYYTLLRIICCCCFAFVALHAYRRKAESWLWIFAVLAVIYNPLLRIHLDRPFWSAVNLATIAVSLISIRYLR